MGSNTNVALQENKVENFNKRLMKWIKKIQDTSDCFPQACQLTPICDKILKKESLVELLAETAAHYIHKLNSYDINNWDLILKISV